MVREPVAPQTEADIQTGQSAQAANNTAEISAANPSALVADSPRVVLPDSATPNGQDAVANGSTHKPTDNNSAYVSSTAANVETRRLQVQSNEGANAIAADAPTKMSTRDLNLHYGAKHALKGINTNLPEGSITALIGPSGCGKSTFLRCLNRMNDLIENCKIVGDVSLDGENIYGRGVDVVNLRQRVGMVFQKPNPFPMSIFDNIAYGPRLRGLKNKQQLAQVVEESLQGAALWDEVKDDLKKSALALSGGQQQRLCIARALATRPEVLLMDEPASALDPISTLKIEELMRELREQYTIVIVTHNMQQAARVSDFTGFFLMGELVEMDVTSKIFTDPGDQRTEDYITGRFG